MEKVKERIIIGLGVGLVYILIIASLLLINSRVDYIEGLNHSEVNNIAFNK